MPSNAHNIPEQRPRFRSSANAQLGRSTLVPVAIHEAGHAVLAAVFGAQVFEIDLGSDDRTAFVCHGPCADWRQDIVVKAAGREAGLLYASRRWRWQARLASASDLRDIDLILARQLGPVAERRRTRVRLTRLARAMVQDLWGAIVDVAALAMRGDFEGDHQICHEVLPRHGLRRAELARLQLLPVLAAGGDPGSAVSHPALPSLKFDSL